MNTNVLLATTSISNGGYSKIINIALNLFFEKYNQFQDNRLCLYPLTLAVTLLPLTSAMSRQKKSMITIK